MNRRDLLVACSIAGTTALAGCTNLLGGDSGGRDPRMYRRWLPLKAPKADDQSAPSMYVVHADAIEHRSTAERIWTGSTGDLLLDSSYGSCFASGTVNAVTTTSDASTVADFVVEEGGTRLDVSLPDGYAGVRTADSSMPLLVGPDGAVWDPLFKYIDDAVVAERIEALASQSQSLDEEYEPNTATGRTLDVLTADAGVPDLGHFETHVEGTELREVAPDVPGLSVAHDIGESETSVTVSVLFEASATPDAETAREVVETRNEGYMGDPFGEFDEISETTDDRFVRLEATAPTDEFKSN